MATISRVVATGRRMKSAGWVHYLAFRELPGPEPFNSDLAALAQPLGAFHHHQVSRRQPLVDGGLIPLAGAERHRAHGDGLIGLHQVDEGPLGAALDGGRGHDRDPAPGVQQQPGIDELVGEELMVFVGELGPEAGPCRCWDRSGCRWSARCPVASFLGLLAIIGLHRQAHSRPELGEHRRQVVLGDGEDDRDGFQLGDDGQIPVVSVA